MAAAAEAASLRSALTFSTRCLSTRLRFSMGRSKSYSWGKTLLRSRFEIISHVWLLKSSTLI